MNEFDRPNFIREVVTHKGKVTIKDRYSFSKFDVAFYALITAMIVEAIRLRLDEDSSVNSLYGAIKAEIIDIIEYLRTAAEQMNQNDNTITRNITNPGPAQTYGGMLAPVLGSIVGSEIDRATRWGQSKPRTQRKKKKLVSIDESRLE